MNEFVFILSTKKNPKQNIYTASKASSTFPHSTSLDDYSNAGSMSVFFLIFFLFFKKMLTALFISSTFIKGWLIKTSDTARWSHRCWRTTSSFGSAATIRDQRTGCIGSRLLLQHFSTLWRREQPRFRHLPNHLTGLGANRYWWAAVSDRSCASGAFCFEGEDSWYFFYFCWPGYVWKA